MQIEDMTLKEIEARDNAIRTRAHKLGKLRNKEDSARRAVASLEAKLAAPTPDIDTLKAIVELAEQIPATLVTRGSQFSPGGFALGRTVRGECAHALNALESERAELQQSLPAARQRLADAEARLKAFTETR